MQLIITKISEYEIKKMKKYWTCSKFADWVRGTPSLRAGTSEEWKAWEKQARKKKYRYWLAEEGIDYLERLICWPTNRISDLRYYVNNRWITKSHALTSNLKRGSWYDFDTRLLHAAFDELVNFVEIEQAWMQVVFSAEERKKYKTPWYRTFFRLRLWRCPEAGLDYLKWASDLKNDDAWIDKDDPEYGQPTSQALAAKEIFQLYKWWKEERPERPDPYEVSGWSEYCDIRRNEAKDSESNLLFNIVNKEKDERMNIILRKSHEIEREQMDEDTAMLIRLVKIRGNLWT
jgi:hypothetical protein